MARAKTCVYYDLVDVTDDDVQSVLDAGVTGHVVHYRRSDAGWNVTHEVDTAVLPSSMAPEFANDLMRRLDQLSTRVRSVPGWQRALVWDGIDLLEAARYEWFYGIAAHAHRGWIVERILKERRPDALVWVRPAGSATQLAESLPLLLPGVSVRVHELPGEPARVGRVPLSRWRRPLHGPRQRVARYYRTVGPRRSSLHPGRRAGTGFVLFVEQYAPVTPVLTAVARALASESGTQSLLAAANADVLAVAREHGPAELLSGLASRRARAESLRREAWVTRVAREVWEEEQAQVAGGLWGRWGALVSPGVPDVTAATWRLAARFAVLGSDLVTTSRPAAVASTTWVSVSVRATVLAARREGIPTFLIQHGRYLMEEWRRHFLHDRFLVWGEADARKFEVAGISRDRVEVTGSPKLDDAASVGAGERTEEFRVAYLPDRSGRRNVVSPARAEEMLGAVVRSVQQVAGASLTVKVHPGDTLPAFDDGAARGDFELLREADPAAVMAGADVVVTGASTTGFEACALDRPLLVLAFPGLEVPPEYEEYGSALLVSDEQALRHRLEQVRAGDTEVEQLRPGRRRMVDELFDGLRAGAIGRIAASLSGALDQPVIAASPASRAMRSS